MSQVPLLLASSTAIWYSIRDKLNCTLCLRGDGSMGDGGGNVFRLMLRIMSYIYRMRTPCIRHTVPVAGCSRNRTLRSVKIQIITFVRLDILTSCWCDKYIYCEKSCVRVRGWVCRWRYIWVFCGVCLCVCVRAYRNENMHFDTIHLVSTPRAA